MLCAQFASARSLVPHVEILGAEWLESEGEELALSCCFANEVATQAGERRRSSTGTGMIEQVCLKLVYLCIVIVRM